LQSLRPFSKQATMNFRDYAAKEASVSVRRAFTRSADASRQQLDTVRAALDAAAKALASVGSAAQKEEEQDVADLATRLTKAAAAAAEQAAKQVSDEAQKAGDAL